MSCTLERSRTDPAPPLYLKSSVSCFISLSMFLCLLLFYLILFKMESWGGNGRGERNILTSQLSLYVPMKSGACQSLSRMAWQRNLRESKQAQLQEGRTDPEAEAPILWPSDEKRRLPGNDPDVGKV